MLQLEVDKMEMTLKVKLVPSNMSGFKSQINKAGQTMMGGGQAPAVGGLGGIGAILGKIAVPLAVISTILSSSKHLQKELSKIMKSVFMVVRPIGDILSMFLRPISDVMRIVGKVVLALWRPMQKQINQQLRTGGQMLRAGNYSGAMGAYGSAFGMLFKPLTDLISAPIVEGVKNLALGTVDVVAGLASTITGTFFDIGAIIVSGLLMPLEGMGLILKTLTFGAVGDELIGLKDGVIKGIIDMKDGSLTNIELWKTDMKTQIENAFSYENVVSPVADMADNVSTTIRGMVQNVNASLSSLEVPEINYSGTVKTQTGGYSIDPTRLLDWTGNRF